LRVMLMRLASSRGRRSSSTSAATSAVTSCASPRLGRRHRPRSLRRHVVPPPRQPSRMSGERHCVPSAARCAAADKRPFFVATNHPCSAQTEYGRPSPATRMKRRRCRFMSYTRLSDPPYGQHRRDAVHFPRLRGRYEQPDAGASAEGSALAKPRAQPGLQPLSVSGSSRRRHADSVCALLPLYPLRRHLDGVEDGARSHEP